MIPSIALDSFKRLSHLFEDYTETEDTITYTETAATPTPLRGTPAA